MMQMQKVCGLVFISGAAHQLTAQVPTVFIDRISTDPDSVGCMITSDNVTGGYLATKELLEQGARRILFMTSSKRVSGYEERYMGYCKAMEEFGLPASERRTAALDSLHYEGAKEKMSELLHAGLDIDGVFAGSDWLALGCYMALREHGKRIPEDVKLAGYDDISITSFNAIPITTVHQQVDEMGRLAAERLIGAMNGKQTNQDPIRVPVYLVPRKSTRG